MKQNPLRIVGGVILGFLVFALVSQALILMGPVVAGWGIMALDLPTNPRLAVNLEAVGNIAVFVVSVYLGIKTYNKVAGNKTKTTNSKKRNKSLVRTTWIVWTILVAILSVGGFKLYQDTQKVTEGDRAVLHSLADSLENRLEEGSLTNLPVNVEGDSQAMAEFVNRFIPDVRRLDMAIQETAEMSSLDDIEFLRSGNFTAAVQTIKELNATYDKNRTERLELLDRMRQESKTIDLPEKRKATFISGVERTHQTHRDTINSFFDTQKQVFELSLEFLDFIENANYEIVDDQIYFVTDNEVNIFNDYLVKYNRLVVSEETVAEEIVSEQQDHIEELREMAK